MIAEISTIVVAVAVVLLCLRTFLSFKSIAYSLRRLWRYVDDKTQVHQTFAVPRFTDSGQENPLYRRAAVYVAALPSLEDSAAAALFSTGRKTNDFYLLLGNGHSAADFYLGARLSWTNDGDRLVLRLRRQDRTRVLKPYLQHVEAVADDLELRRREIRLFTAGDGAGKWRTVPFTHPATLETVAMDLDLKSRVRGDLEAFLKGRGYYTRLGRVWRRSYLLYGPPGTGKSTFVAAMAKFLSYDIYDLDLSRLAAVGADDLKALLLTTTPRSLILIEDLDRYLKLSSAVDLDSRLAGILNFMDGIFSCCGEERVMVFTMTTPAAGLEGFEPAILRPGRLDVHIHFPLCDFSAFKMLACNYLGLTDHKLYPQVEEVFQNGAKISPAEVGEIMIANRSSPSRALKTVINALQHSSAGSVFRRLSGGGTAAEPKVLIDTSAMTKRSGELFAGDRRSGELRNGGDASPTAAGAGFGKEPIKEFKKLYGLIKMRSGSRRDSVVPVEASTAAAAVATAGGGALVKDNS